MIYVNIYIYIHDWRQIRSAERCVSRITEMFGTDFCDSAPEEEQQLNQAPCRDDGDGS